MGVLLAAIALTWGCSGPGAGANTDTATATATATATVTDTDTATATATATDTDSDSDSGSASIPAEMRPLLEAHNAHRAAHCAGPLAWDGTLAARAQSWADTLRVRGCAFEHSRGDVGENLAGGTAGTINGGTVTDLWYREVGEYDFRRGGFSMRTGHFTQLVWRATDRIGCGRTECNGLEIWVCNYSPAGNVQGEYATNVRRAGSCN